MYVSIRDEFILWAWPTLEEGLRALELDAVEFNFERDCKARLLSPLGEQTHLDLSDKAQAEKFRSQLEAKGVRASALLLGTNFNAPDVDGEIKWVVNAIRAAEIIGAEALRIDAIMHDADGWPLEKRINVFAECMKRVLDATPDSKIEMGIENHGVQGNNQEFLTRVMDSAGSDRVGLTMDTGNFYWAGYPLDVVYGILENLAPRTKHTHCKNICYPVEMRSVTREPGWQYGERACLIRKGDIDHRRVAAMLKKAGYKRDLCIEDESLWGPLPEQVKRAGMIDNARYLKEVVAAV